MRQRRWVVGAVAVMWAGSLMAQTAKVSMPEWQKAAGGAMSFEVASIRVDQGPFRGPSFALSSDDWFREPNGRFHADFALPTYIEFAYKLWLTGEERRAMLANLPAWVKTDRFAIEATAPEHATKDQYRLMMQALLAERFKLAVHIEDKEVSVLAMVLDKPGKTGPKLIPHEQGLACDEKPKPDTFPRECYSFTATPKGDHMIAGSRATPLELIGKFLASIGGGTGEIGRPVVDQTGLTGRWDFTLEVAVPFGGAPKDAEPANGASVLEAMQEQLGIKLKPAKVVMPVLVIDHVERPSEN